MSVRFLFSLFSLMFGSVCSIFSISLGICRCSYSHSSGYRRLSERLTTFFVDSRTFAALMFPSLLVTNSTILPNFHEPLGKSFLRCTMFQFQVLHSLRSLEILASVSTILEGSVGNYFIRSSKMIPAVFILFYICFTGSTLMVVDLVRNPNHSLVHLQ